MSIFGGSKSTSTAVPATQIPVYEGYDQEVNGDIIALQESLEDQMAIIEAIHTLDMEEIALRSDVKVMEASGSSEAEIASRYQDYSVVTESMVKNAWDKIKKFFAKLWGKIKAFFKSAVQMFDSLWMSSKKFIEKYEGELKRRDLTGFKYKMFVYKNIDGAKFMDMKVPQEANKLLETAKVIAESREQMSPGAAGAEGATKGQRNQRLYDEVAKLKEQKEEMLDAYRRQCVEGLGAGSGSLSASQFDKVLYAGFRNGAYGKDAMKEEPVTISQIIEDIKSAGDGKAKAEAFSKTVDEEFSRIIKEMEQLESKSKESGVEKKDGYDAKHNEKVISAAQGYASLFSGYKDIHLTVFRAWKTAFAERNTAYKQCAAAALRYKPKKD